VILLFLLITFLFFFFRLLPGSYLDVMSVQGASHASIVALKHKWGLDQPLYVQYYRYMTNFVTGNVGVSREFHVSVLKYVQMRIFNSLLLAAPAITVAYIIGGVLGGYMGSRRGSKIERHGIVPLIFAGSFPAFFMGIVLIIFFAGQLNWVPTGGMVGFQNPYANSSAAWWQQYLTWDFALHYILPFGTIVLRYAYLPTLIMRTNVVEVLGQDFFFYHRITGLTSTQRFRRLVHHAILPIVTLYPISLTRAIGGLVVIEMVFNWPGIGFSLVQAVFARDYPVVQFVFFLIAAFVIVANFGIDILYGYIDPRVTIGGE